jgi:hypothetical protein
MDFHPLHGLIPGTGRAFFGRHGQILKTVVDGNETEVCVALASPGFLLHSKYVMDLAR